MSTKLKPRKKMQIVNSLDDVIADKISDKKPNQIVTELFMKGINLNILRFLPGNLILRYRKMLD